MEQSDRLTNALRSLTAALDLLDAAVERRAQADAMRGDLEQELAVMQDDRARLAEDLDASAARSATLSAANTEVARRLDSVGAVLQAIAAAPADSPPSSQP